VVSIGGQETALFLTRGQRAARFVGLDRLARIKVLPISIGPPFGVNVLDLPLRLPLPAKIRSRCCRRSTCANASGRAQTTGAPTRS